MHTGTYWIPASWQVEPWIANRKTSRHDDRRISWQNVEHNLRNAWDRYSEAGAPGVLYRDYLIRPLHDRFNAGERSLKLLCEILSI